MKGDLVVNATPKLMRVTGRLVISEFKPQSVVSQVIKVSVTPSEGISQGKVPTKTRFPSAMGSWPMTLM